MARHTSLGGGRQDATWTLGYNPAGQVVSRALSNTAYAYTGQSTLDEAYTNNGLNQVTAVDGASVFYDGRGNIVTDPTGFGWGYDASNRLTQGDTTGITIATYDYDPAGRMWSIDAGGFDRRLVYAGGQAIAEYDGLGSLIQRYVPGAGLDDYAAYTVGTGGSITRSWPVTDPLGSVAALVNSANVATQINAYDEYGAPQAGYSGRFGYAGAMFLDFAGPAPWHMRNRQYAPGLGRFMQTDPIGYAGGINLYAYVGADPVNLVDPWGLCEVFTQGVTCVDEIVVTRRRPGRRATHSGPMGGGHVVQYEMVFIERYYLINGVPGSVVANCMVPSAHDEDVRATAAGMVSDVLGTTSGVVRIGGVVATAPLVTAFGSTGTLLFGSIGIGLEAHQEAGQVRSELNQGIDSRVVWGGAFARWSSTALVSGAAYQSTRSLTSWVDPTTRGAGSHVMGMYSGLLAGIIWTGSGADQAAGSSAQQEILRSLGCE